ncbi:hypothetical protein [Inhella sp.]|uniref:LIC_13387 family protein n=1 Tax=Inhella sp. TaxID=1921806 RepID=UPI0035B1E27B
MLHPASWLVAASALIVGALGAAHLFFTFHGPAFHPRDRQLLQRLQQVAPVISKQTTMWRAGLGFHASHSLGVLLFAACFAYLALAWPGVFFGSMYLMGLGLLALTAYFLLARAYWFRVPQLGIALALALYGAALSWRALG